MSPVREPVLTRDTAKMFRVVFICTGNRARSATAQEAFRRLTTDLPVEVTSAGTLELGAKPALPEAVTAARRIGLDLDEHLSRHLTEADLGGADLVIGFEIAHVAAAVVEGGADVSRTFTIREFLRLLSGAPPVEPEADLEARARAVVQMAHNQRKKGPNFVPGEDLDDPLGRGSEYFDSVAETIEALSRRMFVELFTPKGA